MNKTKLLEKITSAKDYSVYRSKEWAEVMRKELSKNNNVELIYIDGYYYLIIN